MSAKLVCALLCVSILQHTLCQERWIPAIRSSVVAESFSSAQRAFLNNSFSNIFFPLSYFTRAPERGRYAIFFELISSEYADLCNNETLMQFGCVDYFCTDRYYAAYVNNSKLSDLHLQLHNFCFYCIPDAANTTQLASFIHLRQLLYSNTSSQNLSSSSCPHFSSSFLSQASTKAQCGETGYPLFLNEFYAAKGKQSPFLCYCTDLQRYGYLCDAYTSFFFMLNYYIKPWLFVVMNIILIILQTFFVTIPMYINAKLKNKANAADSKWKKIVHLFDRRFQSLWMVIISEVLFILEPAYDFFDMTAVGSVWAKPFLYNGVFRIFGAFFIVVSYGNMLILWHSIISHSRKLHCAEGFSLWSTRILTAILYVGLAINVVIYLALSFNPYIERFTVFFVAAVFFILYSLLFPIGFTIYGVIMYITLRRLGVSFRKQKVTQFMLIGNVAFVSVAASVIGVAIGYIAGYDYLGHFLGLYRNVFLDFPAMMLQILILTLLFNTKQFLQAYLMHAMKIFPENKTLKRLHRKYLVDKKLIAAATPHTLASARPRSQRLHEVRMEEIERADSGNSSTSFIPTSPSAPATDKEVSQMTPSTADISLTPEGEQTLVTV